MWNQKLWLEWSVPVMGLIVIGLTVLGFQSPPLENHGVEVAPEGEEAQTAGAYRAKIGALDDSGVTGNATFTVAESGFKVQVNAKGLGEGTHPQHIHEGSSCDSYGGVLLPLEPFPKATGGGTISYQSGELSAPENLADRTVVIHSSEGTPVACGEINPAKGNQ